MEKESSHSNKSVETEKKVKKNSVKSRTIKWGITISIVTFLLSLFFSFISNTAVNGLEIIPAIVILLAVIGLGIIFDLIATAVTVAKEEEFHAMAAKKQKGAKKAIKLIRNSPRVANFCADVIGDICGVLSGAVGAIIALKLTETYGMSDACQYIISALVASLTVGGKAFTKEIAKKNSTKILSLVSKVLSFKN